MHEPMTRVARAEWPRMLGMLEPGSVIETAERLKKPFRIEHRKLPRAGLALLVMKEGCFGENFHLCEIPIAECLLDLSDNAGKRYPGAARVMSMSSEYAEAVAIIDAILAHKIAGADEAASLVEKGRREAERVEAERTELRERTRVDFALMAQEAGSDDD